MNPSDRFMKIERDLPPPEDGTISLGWWGYNGGTPALFRRSGDIWEVWGPNLMPGLDRRLGQQPGHVELPPRAWARIPYVPSET